LIIQWTNVWAAVGAVGTVTAAIFAAWQIKVAANQLRIAASAYHAAAEQTAIAAKASVAASLGTVSSATRDFQWKVVNDSVFLPILVPNLPSGISLDDVKRQLLRGMLISHYSFIFELQQLGQLPKSTWAASEVDMFEFFSAEPNKVRWKQVAEFYGKDFQDFVNGELLRRPK
jgi:hypothetical protein